MGLRLFYFSTTAALAGRSEMDCGIFSRPTSTRVKGDLKMGGARTHQSLWSILRIRTGIGWQIKGV